LNLGKQHAVGKKFHDRAGRGFVVEADLASHFAAPLDAEFFGDAPRDRQGGNATRLGAGDAAGCPAACREAHLRDLRGFTGARFTGEDDDRVRLNGRGNLLSACADGEFGRELQLEGKEGRRSNGHEI
jgi:hypothetical protein